MPDIQSTEFNNYVVREYRETPDRYETREDTLRQEMYYKKMLVILENLDDRICGIEISIKHLEDKFGIKPIKGNKLDFILGDTTNEINKNNPT